MAMGDNNLQLDECLRNIKVSTEGQAMDPVIEFLEKICDAFLCQTSSTSRPFRGASRRASVCFLTRPEKQVADAIADRPIVINIEQNDVCERASRFLDAQISRLVDREQLPDALSQRILQNLNAKLRQSDSAFQWAHTVIERLKARPGSIEESLESIRPGIYSVYTEVLRTLQETPEMADLTANLINFLVFGRQILSLSEIVDACTITEAGPSTGTTFQTGVQLMRSIVSKFQGLVILENDIPKLSHDSVRDYFLQLPESDWPLFSCSDQRQGHRRLGFLCIRYLTYYLSRPGPQDTLGTHNGHEFEDLNEGGPFLRYAITNWSIHLRQAGSLPEYVMDVLNNLMQEKYSDFRLMVLLTLGSRGALGDPVNLPHPSFFAAENGLLHVLQPRVASAKHQASSRLTRFAKTLFHRRRKECDRPSFTPFVLDVDAKAGSGLTLLHVSAREGFLEDVKYLLRKGASGNVSTTDGHSPFTLAVHNENQAVAEELIRSDQAFVLARGSQRHIFPLHMACYANMEAVVKFLLKTLKMDPNSRATDEGWTGLHFACQKGHIRLVDLLLDCGADVRLRRDDGLDALYLAAEQGHSEICQRLFDARPDLDPNASNKKGRTPLFNAVLNGDIELARLLIEKKAVHVPEQVTGLYPVHAAAIEGSTEMIKLIVDESNVNQPSIYTSQPIHCAIQEGNLEAVKQLIALGADIEAKMKDYRNPGSEVLCVTPIMAAADAKEDEIVNFLLGLGVQVKEPETAEGWNMLHIAASRGNLELAKHLTDSFGMDAFKPAQDGESPFSMAADSAQNEVLEYFWTLPKPASFNINAATPGGLTALASAVRSPNTKTIGFLLEHGADAKIESGFGLLAGAIMSEGSRQDVLEVIGLLLDHGANPAWSQWDGSTPLHAAAQEGCLDIVKLLHSKGADMNLADIHGATPLMAAMNLCRTEVIQWLLQQGADTRSMNGLGWTFMDMARGYGEIWALPEVQQRSQHYTPISEADRKQYVESDMKRWLAIEVEFDTRDQVRELIERKWAFSLGERLLALGMLQDAKIAFEHTVSRTLYNQAEMHWGCARCGQRKISRNWWCQNCKIPVLLCDDCYALHKKGSYYTGCDRDHVYLEIGDSEWEKLERGTVNQLGWTFSQWVEDLRQRYGVEGVFPMETWRAKVHRLQ